MKTRAAVRNQLVKTRVENAKAADLEQKKLEAEIWLKEGVVINPKFKEPSSELMAQWKLFVTSAMCHPNMLVHQDFQCIRDLLQFFGVYITYETCKLVIELDTENRNTSLHHLQPYSESLDYNFSPLGCSMFGKVEKFQFIPDLNAVVILEYKIMPDFLSALSDMVDFIWTYPEALFYDNFAFIYQFLIKFRVSSDIITYEIYQTQCRRAQNKIPASSLLVKLGIPESQRNAVEEEELIDIDISHGEYTTKKGCSSIGGLNKKYDDAYGNHWKSSRRGSDSSLQSEDSGVETSCEESLVDSYYCSTSTSTSDFDSKDDELKRPSGIIYARKSVVKEKVVTLHEIDDEDDDEDEDDAERKPFKCTTCKRRYISKGNCNWHIRKSHPGAPLLPGSKLVTPSVSFYCSVCGKGFTAQQYVKNHIERLHPKESANSSSFKFLPMKKASVLNNVKLEQSQRWKQQTFNKSDNDSSDGHKSFKVDEALLQRLIVFSQPEIKLIAVDEF